MYVAWMLVDNDEIPYADRGHLVLFKRELDAKRQAGDNGRAQYVTISAMRKICDTHKLEMPRAS